MSDEVSSFLACVDQHRDPLSTLYRVAQRTGVNDFGPKRQAIKITKSYNDPAPCRLHDLRDTHASLLGEHGVPLEVISKRLGHATVGVTAERYLHVYKKRDAEAAALFEPSRQVSVSLETVGRLLDKSIQ